ncbi:MAG: sulfotransferase [Elusimicrobia bacterium]|nr:sulfotransferase [Elusimicrobiota bacterium]
MVKDPIFIIGTERSGTNLLRLILDAHPAIAVPHPPHILKNLFALEPAYGDLSDDRRFRTLIRDVAQLVAFHAYPWGFPIDEEDVFRSATARNLVCVYFAVHDQYAAHAGKPRWCCKSTHMLRHVALVRQHRPAAKFILMVRDGRDVAVSARESIFNRYSVYHAARLWQEEQRIGMYWLDKLSEREIHCLRYEDLLAEPERTVKALCAFLGLPFQDAMLRYHETPEARTCASLSQDWRNTDKPLLRGNAGRFRQALDPKEIDLYEAIAAPELDRFGYPLCRPLHESERQRALGIPFRLHYALQEFGGLLRVQGRRIFQDRNFKQRLRKFCFLQSLKLRRDWL